MCWLFSVHLASYRWPLFSVSLCTYMGLSARSVWVAWSLLCVPMASSQPGICNELVNLPKVVSLPVSLASLPVYHWPKVGCSLRPAEPLVSTFIRL